MSKKNSRTGVTLIEILVSSVIIAMTLAGFANVFVAGRRYIEHSRARMSGGELGKLFLDPLQMQVRQDTWGQAGNGLSVALPSAPRFCDSDSSHAQQPGCPSQTERTLNNTTYNARYIIDNVDAANLPDVRRVQLTVSWHEL